MLKILAVAAPLILIVLWTQLIAVITPTQSRLGALPEHKMGSAQDLDSSEDRLKSRSEDEDLVPALITHSISGKQRPPMPPRFSSIDVMAGGKISVASTGYTLPSYFSLDKSTEENYSADGLNFYGIYETVRSSLDYSYHGNYTKSRQLFQDKIIAKLLDGALVHDSQNGMVCRAPTEPWIVFTAGVMGAGKSHTMHRLASQGYFPLHSYVSVDPDEIRQQFPEFHLYASLSREKAGERTHKEAGYVTEIVTAVALKGGYNVLVDGSLRDWKWYSEYFQKLKKEYKMLRVAILYVSAPREKVFERAKNRAKVTGRVIPEETLEMALKQVPISIEKLSPQVDYFCELDNSLDSGEITIKTSGVTWDSFRNNWLQTCPWPGPRQNGKM